MRAGGADGGTQATSAGMPCQGRPPGVVPPAWSCSECRGDLTTGCTTLRPGCRVDAELVIYRLEEAGRTLLALPHSGPSTRLVQGGLEWVKDAEFRAVKGGRVRPTVPSASMISRMDRALGWVALIPPDRYVLRRVVGARCLVNPSNGRYLYSWRRVGAVIGADYKAVQRWHAMGIDLIVARLRGR